MRSTHVGHLNIPDLSQMATKTHFFKHIEHPLISLGQLCDDGCVVTLTRTEMRVTKDARPVMTGTRNKFTRMWEVDIPQHQAHNAYKMTKAADIVNFHHLSSWSPVKSTWLTVVKMDITSGGRA